MAKRYYADGNKIILFQMVDNGNKFKQEMLLEYVEYFNDSEILKWAFEQGFYGCILKYQEGHEVIIVKEIQEHLTREEFETVYQKK